MLKIGQRWKQKSFEFIVEIEKLNIRIEYYPKKDIIFNKGKIISTGKNPNWFVIGQSITCSGFMEDENNAWELLHNQEKPQI